MNDAARTVLVPVAHGSEEIETVTIIDVLRRAGAQVTVASVEETLEVRCSRGVRLVADVHIDACADIRYDMIALPGGAHGAQRLRDCAPLIAALHAQRARGAPYAAICAAPAVVLAPCGLLPGRATAHPAFFAQLQQALGDRADPARVVQDGPVVTSRAPGTTIEFALALVAQLYGSPHAAEVAAPLLPASIPDL